jgi:hypothetical protein
MLILCTAQRCFLIVVFFHFFIRYLNHYIPFPHEDNSIIFSKKLRFLLKLSHSFYFVFALKASLYALFKCVTS